MDYGRLGLGEKKKGEKNERRAGLENWFRAKRID